MPKFNVEHDLNFDAQTAVIDAVINAMNLACPGKRDQLMGYVFAKLGLSIEQQSVISYMLKGDIDPSEVMSFVRKRKESLAMKGEKKKLCISNDRLKTIFKILVKEKLIKAANTWQFITYWLEKNCEGWTGGKSSQSRHLQEVLGEDMTLPTRAFKTHSPKDLKEVMENPNGKMGRFHSAAIMRLKQLCEEVRTA